MTFWFPMTRASGDLTGVTSIINGSFTKLGTAADQEYIDFSSSNEVNTKVNDTTRLSVTDTGVDITGDTGLTGNVYLGGIPATTASVAQGATTIVCFKTTSNISAGHAVEITDDMTVGPYTSNNNDTCVGIALDDATGSMIAAVVKVQVSGLMKVAPGISDFGVAVTAGQMCTCSSGVISSQGSTNADDSTDFFIVKSGTSNAYVMWVKGSVY